MHVSRMDDMASAKMAVYICTECGIMLAARSKDTTEILL